MTWTSGRWDREGDGWDEAEIVEFQMSGVDAIHSVDFIMEFSSSVLSSWTPDHS